MCRGRASASASGAGVSIAAADDRLDDLAELRRMRRRQEDPPTCPLPRPPDAPSAPCRRSPVRIEQIAARLVDALDRPAHLVVACTGCRRCRCRIASTSSRYSHSIRSKLLGWPTSIAFAIVRTDGRGANRPVVEVFGHDVVDVGRRDEPRDRQPGALRHQARGQVAEVAARRADDDSRRAGRDSRARDLRRPRGSSRPSAAAGGRR